MKKNWKVSGLAAGLALLLLLPAMAQQQGGWLQRRRASIFAQKIVSDLNLSDDQRAQIKTILREERPAIQALLRRTEQANAQLRARGSFDEGFVRSVAEQQTGNFTDALVEKEKIRARIQAALTPEQQQKFNQLTDQFRTSLQDKIANLGDAL